MRPRPYGRMHVPEESDSGVLPMNHSNKDKKLLAESEEGRPLIKENIHQPSTHSTQSEERVPGVGGVRGKQYDASPPLSEIRAVCVSERSYGSARGATSDGRPYRDPIDGLSSRKALFSSSDIPRVPYTGRSGHIRKHLPTSRDRSECPRDCFRIVSGPLAAGP